MNRVIVPSDGISGVVVISGAKNSALLLLAASVLATDKVVLRNMPMLEDVKKMCELLSLLNIKSTWVEERVLEIDPKGAKYCDLNSESCSSVRTSLLFIGALLSRFGRFRVKSPGGCKLGPRPINFHIEAMREMGALIVDDGDEISGHINASKDAEIHFGKPTVTGLVNALLCAVSQPSKTIIHNCALEPEVDDCISFLRKLGANITRFGTKIEVVGRRLSKGAEHTVIPDRIEAGTFLILGAMLGGKLRLENVMPNHMISVLRKLKESGADYEITQNTIVLTVKKRPLACNINASPYPGFPTDLQPQWCVLSAISEGSAKIVDEIYSKRFDHLCSLEKMGAKFERFPGGVLISGVETLMGANISAENLRSAAALVLAAKVAKTPSNLNNVEHLWRGYDGFFAKLELLEAGQIVL